MNRINTVLAATDFSAPARHAADRAGLVADELAARLELLHVVSQGALDELRGMLGIRPEPVERRLMDEMRSELGRLAVEIGQQHGVASVPHLAAGPVLGEIAGRADAIDADLMVLGARGESFMRHVVLGSTAERLLRKTLRPMLIVKQTPIAQRDCDLIVLGKHGKNALEELLLGSVTRHVLAESNCDVLVSAQPMA